MDGGEGKGREGRTREREGEKRKGIATSLFNFWLRA